MRQSIGSLEEESIRQNRENRLDCVVRFTCIFLILATRESIIKDKIHVFCVDPWAFFFFSESCSIVINGVVEGRCQA